MIDKAIETLSLSKSVLTNVASFVEGKEQMFESKVTRVLGDMISIFDATADKLNIWFTASSRNRFLRDVLKQGFNESLEEDLEHLRGLCNGLNFYIQVRVLQTTTELRNRLNDANEPIIRRFEDDSSIISQLHEEQHLPESAPHWGHFASSAIFCPSSKTKSLKCHTVSFVVSIGTRRRLGQFAEHA